MDGEQAEALQLLQEDDSWPAAAVAAVHTEHCRVQQGVQLSQSSYMDSQSLGEFDVDSESSTNFNVASDVKRPSIVLAWYLW